MAARKAHSFGYNMRTGTPIKYGQRRTPTAANALARRLSKSPGPPTEIKTFARLSPDTFWDHASDDEKTPITSIQ